MIKNVFSRYSVLMFLSVFLIAPVLSAQPEWRPWGNIKGIRVDGQLLPFETSLRAVDADWGGYVATEKYNTEGRVDYRVLEDGRYTYHWLEGTKIFYSSNMIDKGSGLAYHDFTIESQENREMAGLYYCMELGAEEFSGAEIVVTDRKGREQSVCLASSLEPGADTHLRAVGNKVTVRKGGRTYVINMGKDAEVIVRQDFLGHPHYLNDPYPRQRFVDSDPVQQTFDYVKENADYQIYMTIRKGGVRKGFKTKAEYTLSVEDDIDKSPVMIDIDPSKPGNTFDGISGNFRWQFPDKDLDVINYNLDNLRVTWGRVAFFWDEWQPEEEMDPVENARQGRLSERFVKQMEITGLLSSRNIPVMVSVWTPPQWAVDPERKNKRGVILDNTKIEKMAQSIADYLLYIKQEYGVETVTFSFNESDVGVQVFQTAHDHKILSSGFVDCFRRNGLQTKILLGDTGHGTAQANHNIMREVERDPDVYKYGYAVSFHTYHGHQMRDLLAWKRSADILNMPVIIAEGGPDSSAHRYEKMFLDEWFQMEEIEMYLRIASVVQPFSIMPWQLTKDYSVLIGEGIYDDEGLLRPTMRFWNLKQLSLSPYKSFWIPAISNKADVTVAATADIAEGVYTVHLVNNGTSREVVVSGIPACVKNLDVYVTNIDKGMQKVETIAVKDGKASFVAEEVSYITLSNGL